MMVVSCIHPSTTAFSNSIIKRFIIFVTENARFAFEGEACFVQLELTRAIELTRADYRVKGLSGLEKAQVYEDGCRIKCLGRV